LDHDHPLSALVFLYREVLGKEIGVRENLERAKQPQRLPVVLTEAEVRAILAQLKGRHWFAYKVERGISPTVREGSAFYAINQRGPP
jgi:hypothetical protein